MLRNLIMTINVSCICDLVQLMRMTIHQEEVNAKIDFMHLHWLKKNF